MIAAIFSVFVFSLESLLFDVVLSDLEDPLLFSFEVLLSDFEEFLDSSLFALLSLVLTVEEFEDVVIIGCDESGIEQTFDFSSVLKHFLIQPTKDENEHFEPDEVRELLLAKLR